MGQQVNPEASCLTSDIRAMLQLRASGWRVEDRETIDHENLPIWLVSGSFGDHQIHATGTTRIEAWLCAVEQARFLGMLDPAASIPVG